MKGDLVLDFHLGCGTTAAVAHKLKRQYIGVEQLDYGKNDSTIRLQNVINGDKQASARASAGKVVALSSIANFQKRMENLLMR